MAHGADVATMKEVQEAFEELRNGGGGDKLQALRKLFRDLKYRPVFDEPLALPRSDWPRAMVEAIPAGSPGPMVIASAGGSALRPSFGGSPDPRDRFVVIYCKIRQGDTVPMRLTDERVIAQQLLREERYPDCLLVFSDPRQIHWHFVNPRRLTRAQTQGSQRAQRWVLRRISVGPGDRLRTAIERFATIKLRGNEADTLPPPEIHRRHDEAFNVEQVTGSFFQEFKERYFELEDCLAGQVHDRPWAHDFALLLLSRLMFIYFIQRKGWIAGDPDFMANYWQRYCKATGGGDGHFYDRWLHPLFFQAFQDSGTAAAILHLDYMPEDLRQALRNAPYLNGGLFAKSEPDRKYADKFSIPDAYFESLLHASDDLAGKVGFLERYNFTICEDSPLDQEVAVDPEMIGRVYESLVNISEPGSDVSGDRDKQRQAGIFYTPRTEIDLMCRLALSDYLCNHLGEQHRDLIYQLLFSLEAEEKQRADVAVASADLWPKVAELLRSVTVVDPACGSGSFLVGMLGILADLRLRADPFVGSNPTQYELHREIIRNNLYGVDVMEWACHIAELRLWLQLVIHATLRPGELQGPRPLLPNLSFKVLQGDSLVQELGGVNLAHLKTEADISTATKSELRRLRSKKLEFYDADHQYSREEQEQLRLQERKLFRSICRDKRDGLRHRIRDIDHKLAEIRPTLIGQEQAVQGKEREELQQRRAELEAQLENLEKVLKAIGDKGQVPFVWDLAFVEIFEGDRKGFDIVIGNPPYVRQQRIADPQGRQERGHYKDKLKKSVYAAFPNYFGADPDHPVVPLPGTCDYYIYFYFQGLSLLNSNGAFCFVTSNSWLDVRYGKVLQEFLLRQVPIHLIVDNQVRRSFANADVNTVIVLLGAPRPERDACLGETARFVMAQVPFDEILDPVIIQEIEAAPGRCERHEFRVFPIKQGDMLKAGAGSGHAQGSRQATKPLIKLGSYEGDKWGGKYLRAPDIYWEILERAGDRLVPLGEIADVRFGIVTGANEFFYLPSPHFDIERDGDYYRLIPKHEGLPDDLAIEAEYLSTPVIQKTKEILRPFITPDCLKHRVLLGPACLDPKATGGVARYVRWGETQGYHDRPTCAARGAHRAWFTLINPGVPDIVLPIGHKRRPVVGLPAGCLADANFNEIRLQERGFRIAVAASLFTTFTMLQYEVIGRANFGQGLLKTQTYEAERLLVLDPRRAEVACASELVEAFAALAERVPLMVYDEVRLPDRLRLEVAFLRALGFGCEQAPKKAIKLGQATCRLIWQRMAKSGISRESRQTYEDWLASGEPFDANAEEIEE